MQSCYVISCWPFQFFLQMYMLLTWLWKPKEKKCYLHNVYIVHRCTVNQFYITTLSLRKYRLMRWEINTIVSMIFKYRRDRHFNLIVLLFTTFLYITIMKHGTFRNTVFPQLVAGLLFFFLSCWVGYKSR